MAYGDITNDPHNMSSEYREKNGVETINKAVSIKDASTIGSAEVNHLSNTSDLKDLTAVSASNRAALYIGTAGNLCVLLSGQSAPIATGTNGTTATNKLVGVNTNFSATLASGTFIQKRDVVVNTTAGTAAFVGAVDDATNLSLVDAANSNANIMTTGQSYEIYRAVIFQNIPAGTFLPIQVDRIFALGTTADDIVAMY
jgi:hypothetical protein